MKNLILGALSFITLMFGGATHALASAEMPMFYATALGDQSRANLVAEKLIQASLDKNSDGNAYIEGTPCLTPKDLLTAIHQNQPDVQIENVRDLPGLFHSLIPHKARAEGYTGTYELSRMVCTRPGSHQTGDHVNPSNFPREYRANEVAFFLPNHSKPFAAADCFNIQKVEREVAPPPVVRVPVKNPCAYLNVGTHEGDRLAYGAMIPGTRLDDSSHCLGVKFPGQANFTSFVDTCPDRHCSMLQYQRLTGLIVASFGSGKSQGGDVLIRVPAYFANPGERSAIALCLKQANSTQSCGQLIIAASYTLRHDDTDPDGADAKHAYVSYEGEGSAEKPGVNWHWAATYNCWVF